MIKKIHYCWFGGTMPNAVRCTVSHWRELNPDFEIHLHNEDNIDVSGYEFGRRALREKKWGFLADIVRLQCLLEEGGFYLDADIELLRPLSHLAPWENQLILGYMYNCALGTAVCYAPPGHPYVRDILSKYEHIRHALWPVNNSIFTEYFINRVPGFLLNGQEWENGHCKLFRKEFFEQPAFHRTAGMAIHHCCGSWKAAMSSSFNFNKTASFRNHLCKWASRRYRTWRACRDNEFNAVYRAALKGKRLAFDASGYYQNK
ncbi:MAG: hypothetical protein LUG84_02265 [Akkermansiaceae bacterium]|nr:hypothetical protein [Akkermansiaceae bacterium]MCD8070056.1 hypothetical protein [Akkermansiaceae bacterium]